MCILTPVIDFWWTCSDCPFTVHIQQMLSSISIHSELRFCLPEKVKLPLSVAWCWLGCLTVGVPELFHNEQLSAAAGYELDESSESEPRVTLLPSPAKRHSHLTGSSSNVGNTACHCIENTPHCHLRENRIRGITAHTASVCFWLLMKLIFL